MERMVTVLSLNSDGTAEVVGSRSSACGENCAHCGGCGEGQKSIRVTAYNPIGAKPGDRVFMESSTAQVMALAYLVYLMPAVLLLAGCAIKGLLGGLLGLGLGIAGVILLDRLQRKKNKILHTVTRLVQESAEEAAEGLCHKGKGENCFD